MHGPMPAKLRRRLLLHVGVVFGEGGEWRDAQPPTAAPVAPQGAIQVQRMDVVSTEALLGANAG